MREIYSIGLTEIDDYLSNLLDTSKFRWDNTGELFSKNSEWEEIKIPKDSIQIYLTIKLRKNKFHLLWDTYVENPDDVITNLELCELLKELNNKE